MSDLVAWIRAQLDATEAAAKAAEEQLARMMLPGALLEEEPDKNLAIVGHWESKPWLFSGKAFVRTQWGERDIATVAYEHIALHDPAAVLADVEAKRALLEQFKLRGDSVRSTVQPSTGGVWDDLIRMLAEGFRGRPGYEEAMRDGEPPKKLRADTGDGRSLPCLKCGTSTPDASYCDSCGMPFCDNCTHECPCR